MKRTAAPVDLRSVEETLERERSARAEAEAERDSLRALLMQAPAAFALVTGPEHRYVLSNRMNQEFAGGRDLVGKTIREVMPEMEAQGLIDLLEQVYRTGVPFVGSDLPVVLPTRRPEEPPRTAFLSGVYQPLRGPDGSVTGVMAFAYEVTELVMLRRAAEEAEARLKVALAAAELGTWDYDPQTRVLTCDDRFKSLFGIRGGTEATPALLQQAVHPEDVARLTDAVLASFEGTSGGAYSIEYRTIGISDGLERWISLRGRTLFNPAGRPARFTGVALEITAQVIARDRVRVAERNAASIAEAVAQIVWTADRNGRPDFCNRYWYEYTGLPSGSIGDDDWATVVHPDDRAIIVEAWAKSHASSEPFRVEVRLLRASDRSYRWHMAQSIPLKDDDGRVTRWVGNATDIDDHRRVEDLTRFLGDASAMLVESLDCEDILRNVTKLVVPRLADWCAAYLLEPDTTPGYKVFVEHRDPAKVRWALELNERYPPDINAIRGAFNVIRTGQPELYTEVSDDLLVAAAKDADHLNLLRAVGFRSAMTVPITARGRTFGAISFMTAESGRRYQPGDLVIARTMAERTAHAVENARLYAEAQEAIRVRDDFLSIASHELKTPLTPLQLHIQALQQQPPGTLPDKVVRKLDVMARQVDRLERLVSSLVDISRITSRRFDIELEDVDLAHVVRDIAERFGPELERAQCRFTLNAGPPVVGRWDRVRVEQIVTNLLSNAVKFGARQPVEVEVSLAGAIAELVVRDHGIGIDAADQARIFERFERAVPTRHYGGFGLGLWIVRQLVEALGGTITVDSRVAAGSAFTVRLPQSTTTPPQETLTRHAH